MPVSELKHRPKSLLMFVNPFGGRRQGLKIYKEIVKPLLEIAGVAVDLTITQRANHARDFLLQVTKSIHTHFLFIIFFKDVTDCFSTLRVSLVLFTKRTYCDY